MTEQLEKLEKTEKSSWGGKREGSGRKPLLGKEELEAVKQQLAQHGSEVDEMSKKERILSLMDVLFEEGFKKRNIMAIKEYLDRQLGKASQGIDLGGEAKFVLEIAKQVADKYDSTPDTSDSSTRQT